MPVGVNNLNNFNTAAKVQLARLMVAHFGRAGVATVASPSQLRSATLSQLAVHGWETTRARGVRVCQREQGTGEALADSFKGTLYAFVTPRENSFILPARGSDVDPAQTS